VPTSDAIPGLGAKTDRPRFNTAADLSRVQLTPTEGFILSRIDGVSSYDQICHMSSLGREPTLAILRKLKQAKLILGPGEKAEPLPPPPAPPAKAARPRPASTRAVDGTQKTPAPTLVTDEMLRKAHEKSGKGEDKGQEIGSLLARLDDGTPVDAALLREGPDLPDETKMRIVRLHRRLRKLEPHELLGVPADADAATVKRAFAAASKELHPDRYFGKDLGSYREKLAQIFSRITEAVQALLKSSKGKKR
jgi:DnaJ-domain-containing protein 1